jgi:hypothetical protein
MTNPPRALPPDHRARGEEEAGGKEPNSGREERGVRPAARSFRSTPHNHEEEIMDEFKTYRVRYTEWQAFAINVSARTADEACELARNIRSGVGQEPFEEIDGAIENFEAQEIHAREFREGDAS